MSNFDMYFTPEAALEVVRGEIAADSPRPLDAIFASPPFRLTTHSAGAAGNASSAQAKGPTSTGQNNGGLA